LNINGQWNQRKKNLQKWKSDCYSFLKNIKNQKSKLSTQIFKVAMMWSWFDKESETKQKSSTKSSWKLFLLPTLLRNSQWPMTLSNLPESLVKLESKSLLTSTRRFWSKLTDRNSWRRILKEFHRSLTLQRASEKQQMS